MPHLTIVDARLGNLSPVHLEFTRYLENGNTAICGVTGGDFPEPWATYTVNTEEVLPPDLVAIKTWSEGVGAAATLIAAGVIEPEVHALLECGYAIAPVHRLSAPIRRLLNIKEPNHD